MDSARDQIKTPDGLSLAAVKVGTGLEAVLVPNRIYMQPHFGRLAQRHTVVFYDPRNRGESEPVADASRLARGIHHEAEDTDAVRRHYEFDRVAILAHSYACIAAVLYGMMHPSRVSHLILIGPPPPDAAKQYPPELKCVDATMRSFHTAFADLQKQAASLSAAETCAKAWALLRVFYVGNANDADKLKWEPCGIPNEVNFMAPLTRYIMPSLTALRFTEADFAKLRMPTLIVHGRRDRSSPYGGGLDWAAALPNAQLLTIDEAAHAPWIEAPERVFQEIEKLLSSVG